jgi:hypothetical protein
MPPPPPPEEPPVEEEGRCISLSASRTVLTAPGQAVVLTWETDNVDSITINNGVGTFTAANGSVTVNPTSNTTYVGTVSGGSQSDNCRASVRIEPVITEETPRCIDLSANKTTIERGEEVVLTWAYRNASSITINQGVGTFTSPNGSTTVRPTGDTTYTATVPGAALNPECEVRVRIEDNDRPDRDRDRDRPDRDRDRDRERPEAFIASDLDEAEPPLGSVYLSEMPYTGLDLGPIGTLVYWLMIVLWSMAAAYLVLFVLAPKFFGAGAAAGAVASTGGHLPGYGPQAAPEAVHEAAHNAATAHLMAQQSVMAAPVRSAAPVARDGFRSFAATSGALTIDDIVKGLSRESGMAFTPGASNYAPKASAYAEAPQAAVERETPVQATTAYSDDIPGFLEALLNGNRDEVFGTVRSINKQGGDAEHFLTQAVCALDDAYRARVEGGTCHPEIAKITKDCHTSFLERIVTSLATAVDSSYSAGVTGTKLALTRALAIVNG